VAEGQLELQLAQRAGSGRLQLRAPGLVAQAQGSLSQSRGQGTADVTAADFALAQRWLARWPGLGALLKDASLRGQAQAQLAWQGGWQDPSVQARATLRNLAWQVPVAAQDGQVLPWSVRDAQLQVQGRLRDAALELRGHAERGQRKLDVAVAGRVGGTLTPSAWRGRIATLSLRMLDPSITPGPWQVQLQQPVDWRFAGGNVEVSAGAAALQAPACRWPGWSCWAGRNWPDRPCPGTWSSMRNGTRSWATRCASMHRWPA